MIGVRALEAAEIVALDVFNRADGQPISMSVVQQRLEQLRAHRPSCRCGLCGLAVRVRASRVSARAGGAAAFGEQAFADAVP